MKAYVLLDADVINLNFFFKSATLELSEVLPVKAKSILLVNDQGYRRILLAKCHARVNLFVWHYNCHSSHINVNKRMIRNFFVLEIILGKFLPTQYKSLYSQGKKIHTTIT